MSNITFIISTARRVCSLTYNTQGFKDKLIVRRTRAVVVQLNKLVANNLRVLPEILYEGSKSFKGKGIIDESVLIECLEKIGKNRLCRVRWVESLVKYPADGIIALEADIQETSRSQHATAKIYWFL